MACGRRRRERYARRERRSDHPPGRHLQRRRGLGRSAFADRTSHKRVQKPRRPCGGERPRGGDRRRRARAWREYEERATGGGCGSPRRGSGGAGRARKRWRSDPRRLAGFAAAQDQAGEARSTCGAQHAARGCAPHPGRRPCARFWLVRGRGDPQQRRLIRGEGRHGRGSVEGIVGGAGGEAPPGA